MKRAISLFSILGLAFAALADPQTGQPSALTNSIIFPHLLSPTDSVLMTNAEFRCFSGSKIYFRNDNGYQSFHAADLNPDVLAVLHVTDAQLEAQQKNLDAANERYKEEAAATPQAPAFAATDIFGKTIRLSDYRGKVVVLESYTSGPDCPFCAVHYKSGAMQELQRELTTNGVVWLLVDFTPREEGQTPARAKQEWADKKMAVTDYIIDADGSQIGRRYKLQTTPEAVVIAQNGRLAYVGAFDQFALVLRDTAAFQATLAVPGSPLYGQPTSTILAVRDNVILNSLDPRKTRNYVREAALALLAGKPVAVSETKPYGCGLGRIYQ
jgi:peroxiredoxin